MREKEREQERELTGKEKGLEKKEKGGNGEEGRR